MDEKQQASGVGVLQPGQIWLIEQMPGGAIGGRERAVVAGANVILYDRALAPLVAAVLPLGAYAEPLARPADGAGPAISPRALHFAADGWSVVQLVAAGAPGRLDEIADPAPRSVMVGPLAQRSPSAGGTFTANGLAG